MAALSIPRLDLPSRFREQALKLCRLKNGEVWQDPEKGHQVGLCDATNPDAMASLFGDTRPALFINDPPYNITVGGASSGALSQSPLENYKTFTREWLKNALLSAADDAFFYLWLGADQERQFQPLPDLMLLLREFSELKSRSLITMRNQRGYGTQNNWMFVRQELLCYVKGNPNFKVVYTDIPKVLKGYYKKIGNRKTENLERSKSDTIRPGNVWIDIQQVFYRMEENVPGAYAQKPLKAIDRIIASSSEPSGCVADLFAHSGTTLIAAEGLGRRCITCDIDPIFAELTIRRLERLRSTGKTGWQRENPFPEVEPEQS